MKKFNLSDEELKSLFKSSQKEELSLDFTDNVMQMVVSKQNQKAVLHVAAPSKRVACFIAAVLCLLVLVSLLLERDFSASPINSYGVQDVIISLNNYLNNSLIAIVSVTLSLAVWILIFINKRIKYSLPA